MGCFIVLSVALAGIFQSAQAAPLEAKDQAAIRFAQQAVVRALDYSQGDRWSLIDAQDDFTEEGWREFMKRMEGWLDSKGVPISSSSFVPSGDAVVADQENGRIHLTIPGTLQQRQNNSTTTYRVVIDVRISVDPAKIAHMEPIVQVRPRAAAESGPPKTVSRGNETLPVIF
jgi:hypothetical protein